MPNGIKHLYDGSTAVCVKPTQEYLTWILLLSDIEIMETESEVFCEHLVEREADEEGCDEEENGECDLNHAEPGPNPADAANRSDHAHAAGQESTRIAAEEQNPRHAHDQEAEQASQKPDQDPAPDALTGLESGSV